MDSKFWEITVKGKQTTARYGKIGAKGQTSVKTHASAAAAKAFAAKEAAGKEKKGYEAADNDGMPLHHSTTPLPPSHQPTGMDVDDSEDESSEEKPKKKAAKKVPAKKGKKKEESSSEEESSDDDDDDAPVSKAGVTYLEMDSKFWEVTVKGKQTTVRYGKIDSKGQTSVKTHASAAAAKAFAAKEAAGKEKKGYEAADNDGMNCSAQCFFTPAHTPADDKPAKKLAGKKRKKDESEDESSEEEDDAPVSKAGVTYLEMDSKFWEVTVKGKQTTVRYGKIDSKGQTSVKTHASAAAAKTFAAKEAAGKEKKGYEAADNDGMPLHHSTTPLPPSHQPTDMDVDDSEDESSEEKPKKKAAKKVPAKKGKKKEESSSEEESSDDDDDDDDDEDEEPAKKKQKVVQPSAGGRTRIDRELATVADPTGFSIYDSAWAVKLNQTNVGEGQNNNKFYIIQLIDQGGGKYGVFTRWGRVGVAGQTGWMKNQGLEAAKSAFCKKFRDKTKNDFKATVLDKTAEFKKVVGQYGLVDVVEADGDDDDDSPLGKLSESQIIKGQAVLEQLRTLLSASSPKNKSAKIAEYTSAFYTLIPHDVGFKKAPLFTKLETVEEEDEKLKFMLRMGFDELIGEEDNAETPLCGLLEEACPTTLAASKPTGASGADMKSAVKKGEDCLKKQKLAKDLLGIAEAASPKELYGAVLLYTSNCIYRELNKALRDMDRRAVKSRYFSYLRLLFESFNFLKGVTKSKPTELWRGVGVDLSKDYKVGQTITWWGVSSCTSDEDVARNFAGGCAGDSTLLTIRTTSGVDISEISFYQDEKETLLAPGTQLKVLKCKKGKEFTEITLEEVGQAVMRDE